MHLSTPSPLHLTYCTNIHPGESWDAIDRNLKTYLPILKQRLSPHQPFGVGLRLADAATDDLLAKDTLSQFQTWLQEQGLYVFTVNGFPFGGFHHQVVKDRVYAPDWSIQERLTYTQRLIRILAVLLPEGMDGGISTLPLSYKPWWQEDAMERVFQHSTLHLAQAVMTMAQVHQETGKLIHLDLEPEPDGLIENAQETIAFFQNWLLPIGIPALMKRLGVHAETAETLLRRHIRLCYDTCHFAVEYEEPKSALTALQQAGIAIGKFQLSAALKIALPDLAQRQSLVEALSPFAESTYLHQVISRSADGTLQHYTDLTNALPSLNTDEAIEWRIHFHVPIFIDQYSTFASTQDHICHVLENLSLAPECTHLEIETYTWDVLPADMKVDILDSIEREYLWVMKTLL
ncbi:metabolite traffic protein EboE [Microcoleus sp. FACHB-1515]|uniref:metabolite traffic protein EboE n=1 Tax=Cyanophyceae TaxID=3028117 RepID=UPI001685C284|nr:metabolite traffic protein EboE [Microcoleus sp. FACHB-1515]MBD2091340.1 metabolite traffic protein EboE [Microcoleus sp. FACHB-1515]